MIRCPFCDHKNPPGATQCAECKAELFASPEDAAEPAEPEAQSLDGRVLALAREGRKIEAIKLYRDITGAGLKEAKDAVEALERAGTLTTSRDAPSGDDSDVLELLRTGQKIRAIKLYRDKSGCGLAESKNAVETLARKNGIAVGQSGCSSAVLCLLAIALILGYLLA
jgi:large subunit ribosomal protein L7/L12